MKLFITVVKVVVTFYPCKNVTEFKSQLGSSMIQVLFYTIKVWSVLERIPLQYAVLKSSTATILGSHSGIAGCSGNSTVVVLVFNHFDIALCTPFGTPAVLDKPKFLI